MNILLKGIVGSTAYGMDTEDSDIDRIGVFAHSTMEFFRLSAPQKSIVTTNPDMTLHEVQKFCELALKCNPTVTEVLWLPEYEEQSSWGRGLVHMRTSFLSAQAVKNSYIGYAMQQWEKLLRRAEDGKDGFGDVASKRTEKHARHIKRLGDQGRALYSTGTLKVRLEDPQSYLDFGARVAQDPTEAQEYLDLLKDEMDAMETVLPERPDRNAVEEWLGRFRRQMLLEETGGA